MLYRTEVQFQDVIVRKYVFKVLTDNSVWYPESYESFMRYYWHNKNLGSLVKNEKEPTWIDLFNEKIMIFQSESI